MKCLKTNYSIFTDVFFFLQDLETKNWWLNLQDEMLGYFPASLFSDLNYVREVGWGGRTSTSLSSPSPPMGSGVFPDNVYNHASYFTHVSFQINSTERLEPETYTVKTFNDKPDCFFVEYYGLLDEEFKYSLQFGGPGGSCGD